MLTNIGDVITAVITWIVNLFSSITPIFYDSTLNSGAGGFTFVGYLLIIAFGITCVWVVLQFVKKLVRRG